MPYRSILSLLFLFIAQAGSAQCNPEEYARIFSEAVGLQSKEQFIQAKNCFEKVKVYACSQQEKDAADAAIDRLFEHMDQLRWKSDSTAPATYADDLAFKSSVVLERGDRATAFRLAEFAHRYVDGDNIHVIRALAEALYYNDKPSRAPLPRPIALEGHISWVTSVAFSPDGKLLASGSHDNMVKIWDWRSGKISATLKGHLSLVQSVAFSPDGQYLATGSYDKTVKIWNWHNGKEVATLEGHTSGVNSVAFSPDGKCLATGGG
jgi:hypothetical protein